MINNKKRVAWNKGKKCPEHSQILKGRKFSDETKNKMSETHKKNRKDYKHKPECKCFACTGVPYNKGINSGNHGNGFKKGNKVRLGKNHTVESNLKNSKNCMGRKPWNKGTHGLQALENHPSWKGGKSFEPYGLAFNGLCVLSSSCV